MFQVPIVCSGQRTRFIQFNFFFKRTLRNPECIFSFLLANKRRRNPEYPDSLRSSTPAEAMSNTFNFSFTPPSFPAAKKPRVLFSEEQKEALRLAFSMDPYPSTATIEFLANELNLSVRTITNWFHNHRMRLKQNANCPDEPVKLSGDGLLSLTNSLLPGVREGATFDPVQFRTLLSRRMMDLQSQKGSGGGGGSLQYNYPFALYRNCSPLSNAADDSGTLDLSMSSSHHNARSDSISSMRSEAHGGGSIADDHSSSDMNDDSCFSQDPGGATEGSDHESLDESMVSSPAEAPKLPRHGAPNASLGGSSSNRRKPAMPQWVNPGLEMSPDSASDLDDDLEDDDSHEIINGVCVRQMDDFALRIPREEATVRLEPAPAPDLDIQTVTDLRNANRRKIFAPNGLIQQPQGVQPLDLERKLNITRLEKCVKEVADEWGDDSDQGDLDLKTDAKDHWDSFKISSSTSFS